MSWISKLNPFGSKEETAGAKGADGMPQLPPELANDPKTKGMMAMFYRKWKDPAFLKQIRTLASHMQKDGVDIRDQKAVQAWLEKNADAVKEGKFNDLPAGDAPKQETYVKTGPDLGRNDPCHCGSKKKFKKCHGA